MSKKKSRKNIFKIRPRNESVFLIFPFLYSFIPIKADKIPTNESIGEKIK